MEQQMRTKKLTVLAMLSALAYLVMVVGRIPVVMFLKYDPKDVIIVIGGFLFGPLSSFTISVIVSFVEMFTVSDTGWIGCVMNILSTCSFACTASIIYKKKHNIRGAVIGLISGWLLMTIVMILWNYFLVPIYMGMPRAAIADMLIPVFLPFNLLKGGLNAALSMLIYKPITNALRRQHFIPDLQNEDASKGRLNISVILLSCFVILTCILLILVLQKRI